MEAELHIRKAIATDAAAIAALCHQQFQYAHQGGFLPADLRWYVDKTFNTPELEKDISNPSNHYLVMENENGELLGCVKLGPVGLDLAKNIPGAIELSRFYLQPELMGRGLGSILLHQTIALAEELDCSSIWLHVYTKNTNACLFYEKKGFVKAGQQDFPVCESCPVGWVMKYEF